MRTEIYLLNNLDKVEPIFKTFLNRKHFIPNSKYARLLNVYLKCKCYMQMKHFHSIVRRDCLRLYRNSTNNAIIQIKRPKPNMIFNVKVSPKSDE